MANWWDWITPWDTPDEQAAQEAASADAAMLQLAQQPPPQIDPVEQWAVDTGMITGGPAAADDWSATLAALDQAMGPAPAQADPWADTVARWRQQLDAGSAADAVAAVNQPLTGQAYIDQFLAENNQQIPSSNELGVNGYIPPDGSRGMNPAPQDRPTGPLGPDGLWTGSLGDPWLLNAYQDSAGAERAQFQIDQRNAAYDEKYGVGGEGFTRRTWGDAWDAAQAAGSAIANNFNELGKNLMGVTLGQQGGLEALQNTWQDSQIAPILNAPVEAAKALPGAALVAPYTEGLGNKAMNVADTLQSYNDLALSQEPADYLPEGMATPDVTAGGYVAAGREALWATFKEIYDSVREGRYNHAQATGTQVMSDTIAAMAAAVQPTAEQLARMTPAEIERNRKRAQLNATGDVRSVADTFDALVDQQATAQQKSDQAAALYEQGAMATDEATRTRLWTEAADMGAEAYRLQNAHPIELVNENTNIGLSLITELLLPDVTDILGGAISLLKASPKARRLTRVAGEVAEADVRALDELAEFAVGPQARAVAESSYNPRALWRADSWLTTGEARANIAVDQAHRYLSQLLGDVDTASDMKIILRQLSQDPRRLITGMDAGLFQSEALLQRAGSDGLVRFGSMNLANAKEPLRIIGNFIEDFATNAQSLNAGPLLNKYDFATEFHEAMVEAGRKFYNVATDGGDAQRSWLGYVASKQRQAVSPFYIYSSPGTWITNIIGGAATAVGDGTYAGGRLSDMDNYLQKLYGVDPTMRGFEGVESAQSFANAASGAGGILGPVKKAYGRIDENMGKRVYYKSVTHALREVGQPMLQNMVAPILRANGITDPREINRIVNHLFETGYNGGNLIQEFRDVMTGRARVFSLSDVNRQWLEAVDPESLSQLYEIVRKAPDRETALQQLTGWYDSAVNHWGRMIKEAPVVPQRHVWQTQEVAQDMADIAQIGKMVERYGGLGAQEIAAFKQMAAAGLKETQSNFERLAGIVTELQDPSNRYALYDIWGQVTDITTDVRSQLAKQAEQIYHLPMEQRGQAWAAYFQNAQNLWAGRNERVNNLLNGAADAIARGDGVTANVSQWDILERTARQNETKLWETLRLEPQGGAYDTQLQRVVQAGQAISDKALARVYAAARRFNTADAIDYIVSTERNVQMAGAQARAYLDDVLESVFKGDSSWEDYFSIRNETWRQLRVYERDVWGIAERQIVTDGLTAEVKTGLRFDAGPDGMVEIIRKEERRTPVKTKANQRRPVKTETTNQWIVRREDGTITEIPDNMVPDELRSRYDNLTDEIDANVELELDNLASGAAVADDIAAAGSIKDGYRIPQTLDEYWAMVIKGEEPPDNLLPQSILDELDSAPAPRSSAMDEKAIVRAEEAAMGSAEARVSIRDEWDRTVKASAGMPNIDQTIATYTRNGIVNVPENRFEDLYGTTIAGRRIENQDDVNRLLQEYYDLNQQAKGAQAAAKDVKQAVKATKEAADRIAKELNLGARNAVDDLREAALRTARNTTQAGAVQAPDVALAAQHASEQIRNIYNYVTTHIDEIMQPAGALGEGQALRALDDFRRRVVPAWDNAKYIAAEYGNRMRSFTLVDFANNTRLDEIAGVLMPYSFWMTRSAKNSLERAIFEPHIWSRMMKTDREIREMQTQSGDPQRYSGAIPVDLGNGTTYWLKVNPVKYWPTFGLFTQNDYANPESANNAYSFALESMKSANASFYPWLEVASKIASNKLAGNDALEDIYPMSYIPQGRIIGWMAAKMMGPDIPWALRPGYYEYNVGRELTTMVSEGAITAEQAEWAQDMLRQMRTGEQPLPEQAGQQDELTAILQQATQRAANKELLAAGTSLATGVQVKPYNQAERQAMAATEAFNNRGYDAVTNPTGSELAVNATYDQYPELGPKFSQGAIYQTEKKRPGIRAVEGAMWDEVNQAQDTLYTAGDSAVDALITANPDATRKDIDAARREAILAGAAAIVGQGALDAWVADNPDAYYTDVVKFVTETIKGNYPSAGTGPDKVDIATVADDQVTTAAVGLMGQQQFDAFMRANPDASPQQIRDWVISERGPDANKNPVELVESATTQALKDAEELFPYPAWPGDGASREAVNAYYDAKEKADQQRAAWVENRLATIETESGVDPKLLQNSTGKRETAYQDYKNRYKTDLEIERLAEIDAENEAKYRANAAQWAARRGSVVSEFGEEAGSLWDEYYNLPKGSDERKAFMQANPQMKLYNLAAYNPTEYAQAKDLFGNDALMSWVNIPAYADTPEAKAARNAYYDANPKAWLVNAWMWGRPSDDAEDGAGIGARYNFGADYATAREMFGEDIWNIVEGYRRGWDKNIKRAYYNKYPQLSEFFDWWYGNTKTATGTGQRSGSSGGGGGGYRSYGGGSGEVRQPIRVDIQMPYNQGLSRDLAQTPQPGGWRPSQVDLRWMQLAKSLAPKEPREAKVNWIRKI